MNKNQDKVIPHQSQSVDSEPTKVDAESNTRSSAAVSSIASGAGMDREISTSGKAKNKWLVIIVIVLLLITAVYFIADKSSGNSLSVEQNRIAISTVTSGVFEDFIPLRGRVTPAKTVFLDAIEGGRVERILVEDGTNLSAGDLIVELSNTSLQLSVLGNETRVAEQLNNMRSIELSLEQNKLQHKRNVVDIEHQIKLLTRQVSRQDALVNSGAVSQSVADDTSDTLTWYKNRLQLTKESQASDARMQGEQLGYLKATGTRLESNLAISRQNLEKLNVQAPVAGKLSGFNVEVGQSIARGERLGQIDTPDDFKLTAFIDEFYLGRVDIGQRARYKDYQLRIAKIYPQVQNGQFEVDFTFTEQQPSGIRRGQTIQIKLTLGDASEALLIPNGAFFQDTGGSWIFVVTENGTKAVKRTVRLGRRNSRYIEVIEGLEVGEQVVTSPYSSYQDMQTLKFN
jgi:HlyD family secretion protein